MSKKKMTKAPAGAANVTGPREPDAGKRAEDEGMPAGPSAAVGGELEGEGSRTAARHYEAGLAASLARGTSGALAEDARRALEGPEGGALREAESAARRGHHENPTEVRRP